MIAYLALFAMCIMLALVLANLRLLLRLQTMKRVYLDHAAATPLNREVSLAMAPFGVEVFGNTSAIHAEGVAAREAQESARASIAKILGVLATEIIFTGSATESANLAIIGAVRAWKKSFPERTPHVIVSSIEHDAVLAPARILEEEGVRVSCLPVLSNGVIDLAQLSALITMDTVIISLMYANNEVGTIQPVAEAGKLVRKWKKEYREVVRSHKSEGEQVYPLFHTDGVQAANYLDLNIPRLGVDLMTLNASKVYGPKGVGMLYKASGVALKPLVYGGGHEGGMRAGTEHVAGIVGFAKALELAQVMRVEESARLALLQTSLIHQLTNEIPNIILNGDAEKRLPNNINFSLPNVDHEYLAIVLDTRGFAVATKSACNETDAEISHVLLAMREGESAGHPTSGIRLSMGRATTMEDIDALVKTLKEILALGLLTQP